jgi:hypothetical protein
MKKSGHKAHFEQRLFLVLATAALLHMSMLQVSAGNHHANFQLTVLRNSSDLGPGVGTTAITSMGCRHNPFLN